MVFINQLNCKWVGAILKVVHSLAWQWLDLPTFSMFGSVRLT